MPYAARVRAAFFCSGGKPMTLIDINTATAAEIDAVEPLKGHGFEIARYRQERGGFTELRQLEEVPGLAGKTAGLEAFIQLRS
jgi:competence protein ComEA